jgi:hypothetical protein
MDWQQQLISLYLFIDKEYQQKLHRYMERTSNYTNLAFCDEEVITIYMFGVMNKRHSVKDIYEYTAHHLSEWFPRLPGYTAFVQRLNKLSHLFGSLSEALHSQIPIHLKQNLPNIIDSMPIILAHRGRRFNAKVAPEIASKNGYCATKKLHYYGVKLHVMGSYTTGSLPIPQYFGITEAGTADIRVYEQIEQCLPKGSEVYADKAYQKGNSSIAKSENVILYTPVKKAKGQEMLDAADKLLSTAISRVRQPIESFFNWLEEKTQIQIASKVRSYEGLMTHIFGRVATALFLLNIKFSS